MIDYINNNLPGFWIALGFLLLAMEVLLFGFTTIILLFAGLGALLTGLLMNLDILPHSWIAGIASFGIATGLFSAVLWAPLKRMQDSAPKEQSPKSDFIGIDFILDQAISSRNPGSYRYSGISWKVEPADEDPSVELEQGVRVQVVAVEVGLFKVKPI